MKVTHINAYLNEEESGDVHVSFGVDLPKSYSLMDAAAAVMEALSTIDDFTIPESLRRTAPAEETANDTAEEVEAPKRRGRKPKAEVEAAAEEAEPAEEAAPPKRRGRKPKAEVEAAAEEAEPADEGEGTEEISDIQLAKAASVAASKTNPETVTAVLEEFGVTKVNDLSQEDRETFLTTLDIVVG